MPKEIMTPQRAKEILANNNSQNYRKLRERIAQGYARDMKAGNWNDTGDPIAFDIHGELQNGQHRLRGVVIADVNVELTLAYDNDVALRNYYDMGSKRTVDQVLKTNGFKAGTVMAAAKKLEIDVITVRQGRGAQGRYATTPEVVDMILADEDMRWVTENVINANLIPNKLLTRTVALYTYLTLHKVDPYGCAEFFNKFVNIEKLNGERDSAIAVLHKRFTNSNWPANGGRLLRLQQVTVIFRAWNAWRLGQSRSHYKFSVTNDEGKLNIPIPTKESVLTDVMVPNET